MTQQPFSSSLLFITATTIQHKDNKEQYKSAHHQHVKRLQLPQKDLYESLSQKEDFSYSPDRIQQHERCLFATRKVAYQNAKGGLSQRKRYAFTIQYVSSDIIKGCVCCKVAVCCHQRKKFFKRNSSLITFGFNLLTGNVLWCDELNFQLITSVTYGHMNVEFS